MARRSKLSPEQIRASLFTPCTECGYPIQPSELRGVDGKRCRCLHCGADFEPKGKEPETKGERGFKTVSLFKGAR